MERRQIQNQKLKDHPLFVRIAWIILFSALMPLMAYAQERTVNGTVTDSNGEPIIGANIKVDGTTRGAITDIDGNFAIQASANQKLIVTYIGYNTETVNATSTTLSIVLKEDTKTLDEIVVVGYGSQKKATLTGAVSAINNETLITTKNESVVNMMTGKIPGLRVQQKSSEPGKFENSYDIRGLGNPLIVVDGVPRGYMERMDPNEIESISVLKDASAAIYGVRSANGVILITTKKGTNKKMDVSYSFNQGWQQFLGVPTNVSVEDFFMLHNERQYRNWNMDNLRGIGQPKFNESDMEPYLSGKYQTPDWMDLVMKDLSSQTQHNVTVDGGTDRVDYYFNIGYLKQNGAFKSDDLYYDRWNFRANVTAKISDRLKISTILSGFKDNKHEPNQSVWEVFKLSWNADPRNVPYANNNPDYPNVIMDDKNPIIITDADKMGYKTNEKNLFQGQVAIDYDIPGIKGLTARGMYSYDYLTETGLDYRKEVYLYTYDPNNDSYLSKLTNSPSQLRRSFGTSYSTLMQLQLGYDRAFGKHNVNAIGLFEESYGKGDGFWAQRYMSMPLIYLFAGNDAGQQGGMDKGNAWENVNHAWIGKVNYDYAGKYLAEFSFRYDGSCKFIEDKRWGFFPSASVGWRISEEAFIKDNATLNFIDNLKIRASYGKLGDDGATGWLYLSGYDYTDHGSILGGEFIKGVQSKVPNRYISWYTAETFNFGVDMELWNGLFGLTFEYFNRDRDGLLTKPIADLPALVGMDLPDENLNSDRTRGWELSLSHRNRIGDVAYNLNAHVFTTRTMKRYHEEVRKGNSYKNWKESQMNRYTDIWWGKKYGGQFQSYDQIYNHPVNTGGGNQNHVPGDHYFVDWNGDGEINDKDEYPIAVYKMPLVNFALTAAIEWKGIDLNMLFQGVARSYVKYDEQLANPLMWDRNALDFFMDRWHTKVPGANVFDPNTEWVSGYYPSIGSPDFDGGNSTWAVRDASYLRLKSLEIGYTLPKKVINKLGVKNLRVYVSGYNLLTITGLKHSDPEHPGASAPGESWGEGGYKYPLNRSYNIGAKITF